MPLAASDLPTCLLDLEATFPPVQFGRVEVLAEEHPVARIEAVLAVLASA